MAQRNNKSGLEQVNLTHEEFLTCKGVGGPERGMFLLMFVVYFENLSFQLILSHVIGSIVVLKP